MKKPSKRSLNLQSETLRVLTDALAMVAGGARPRPTTPDPTEGCTLAACQSANACATQFYQTCAPTMGC